MGESLRNGAPSPAVTGSTTEGQRRLVAEITKAREAGAFTDLDGVHAEYRQTVALFPLALPAGWAFPAESSIENSEPAVQWEPGSGAAEAYAFWQHAVASEAYEAHIRGDDTATQKLLDVLEAGYYAPIGRMVFDDPASNFIADAADPARRGDFRALKQASVG